VKEEEKTLNCKQYYQYNTLAWMVREGGGDSSQENMCH
jgi:hypothetical protein